MFNFEYSNLISETNWLTLESSGGSRQDSWCRSHKKSSCDCWGNKSNGVDVSQGSEEIWIGNVGFVVELSETFYVKFIRVLKFNCWIEMGKVGVAVKLSILDVGVGGGI